MGILVHNNQCIILRIRLNSQCINRERSCAIRLIFFSRGLCRALVVCWQKRHKESWSFLMDKLLLHSCCAPCSVYCVDTLRADGIEPTSLWFNPNIHPWTEYDARRRTLLEYGEKEHVEVHILEDYGLRDFVRAVSADIDHRCAHCYTIRLGTAAKYASGGQIHRRPRLRRVHIVPAHLSVSEPRALKGRGRDDGQEVRRRILLP